MSSIPAKNRLPVKTDAKPDKLMLRKIKPAATAGDLFERVVGILEQARAGVVRAASGESVQIRQNRNEKKREAVQT
ncbi:MAG: hypothetical protein WCL16_09740 [bacterium]